ncbi:sperm-associated antigen 1-like isoform X2 [Dysidea avara]
MAEKEDHMTSHETSNGDSLPPVRSGNISMTNKSSSSNQSSKSSTSRIKSGDYQSWDKYDVEKELAATETSTTPSPQTTSLPQLLTEKELMKCTEAERQDKAVKEKEKGNEAFHAGDFQEALVYYSRSLQLAPTAIAYNNRAVVEIKLEKYKEAVDDCSEVLKLEEQNGKARMRRAIARHKLKQLKGTKEDLELLLKQNPNHKKAKELFQEVNTELAKAATQSATKPPSTNKRRIKIEEVNEPVDETDNQPKQPTSLDSSSGSHDAPKGSHETTQAAPVPKAVVTQPLPVHVVKLKDQGNKLFQAGQYGEALDCYSNAINSVQRKGLDCNPADVAVLFSNRAACYVKIGDCRSCVKDCTTSIAMAPANSYKPLLRRALAYETMEKFQLAFVDYQLVVHLNGSIEQARMGCTRLARLLQEQLGFEWRKKLPVPPDHAAIMASPRQQVIPPVQQQPTMSSTTPPELTEQQKLKKYEQFKEEGNTHVKKGRYSEAVSCYSECIQLCPDNPVAYSNRALCHLKLHEPTAACDDCTKALQLSPNNVKALFRRAQAMKERGQFSVAIDDLTSLLKIEPSNKAAQKELSIVKEMSSAKQKPTSKGGEKKRVPIIIDDEKTSEKSSTTKDKNPTTAATSHIDVTLSSATPYEFIQKWNSVPKSAGSALHAALLKQVQPQQLPSLLTNKLDGNMLPDILIAIKENFLTEGDAQLAGQILEQLTLVDRFSIALNFISSQKHVIKDIFAYLEGTSSDTELSKLRKLYGI